MRWPTRSKRASSHCFSPRRRCLRRSLRLGVDVDHVAGLSPLIPADWLFGLQVSQAPEHDGLEPTANGRERSCQVLGDAPHGAALMPWCPGLLLLPWIERPPLGAANTASTYQCRCPACALTFKPLVRGAEADPCLAGQISQRNALVNVSTYKPFPADGCQPGIGMAMHGCVRSGLLGPTAPVAASHLLVS
jgi:hypothetical protein